MYVAYNTFDEHEYFADVICSIMKHYYSNSAKHIKYNTIYSLISAHHYARTVRSFFNAIATIKYTQRNNHCYKPRILRRSYSFVSVIYSKGKRFAQAGKSRNLSTLSHGKLASGLQRCATMLRHKVTNPAT